MNPPPLSAAPPPLPRSPRRRWPWLVALGACAALVLVLVLKNSFPSDEERKYFGWWRGWEKLDEDRARAWIAEFADDGAIRIQFCDYRRAGLREPWVMKRTNEAGTWRVRDGVQRLATRDPERKEGWVEQLERFQRTGHWQRVHYYRTTEINAREMRYTAVLYGQSYHALRSAKPIAFPSEPLPPEQWAAAAAP